jgi:hypothetical protein
MSAAAVQSLLDALLEVTGGLVVSVWPRQNGR